MNYDQMSRETLIDYISVLKGRISTYRCAFKEILDCEADYETAVQIANEALEELE